MFVYLQRVEQEEKLVLIVNEHFSQFDTLVLLRTLSFTMEKEKSLICLRSASIERI